MNEFDKFELNSLIKACDRMGSMFANSRALIATGNGRSEKMRQTMLSYKNIFVHFYANVYGYGEVEDYIDKDNSEEYGRYILSYAMVFSNPTNFASCLSQLKSNWSSVITVTQAMNNAGEDDIVAERMNDMMMLTDAFVKLSSYKV